MNEKTQANEQQKRLSRYVDSYNERLDVTPAIKSLLFSLVCCEIEEEQLQQFVDDNGTTYTTKHGIHKQRPEWQQLRDNRQRKTAIVSKLEGLVTNDPLPETDVIAELRSQLD